MLTFARLAVLQGVPTGFLRALSGNFSEVQFVSLYGSPEDLDRVDQLETTDEGYTERITAAAPLFVENSGVRGYLTRIA